MKSIKATFLAMCCASFMGLSSCGSDDIPEPKDYPINDFIFNTFLFAEGSWWAFYDSATSDFDTITVTYSFGQHQNVYEGDELKYYRYYYQCDWLRSSSNKTYQIEYISTRVHERNGRLVSRIDINGYSPFLGNGFEGLFYDNALVNDTIANGSAYLLGKEEHSNFVLIEKSDSLFLNNSWKIGAYVKFENVNSTTNDLNTIRYVFQEHQGFIEHNIDGNYVLVDQNIIPMQK